MTIYFAVWTTTTLALLGDIGIGLSAIPHFKRAAPKEYRLAGSPSPLWSPTSDFILFWYLLRNRHRSLPDQALVRKLSRSEEHTSELQSLMRISYAVFCLKKKTAERQRDDSTKIYRDNEK